MKLIPEGEIPPKIKRGFDWQSTLQKIPKGKALVLLRSEVSLNNAKTSLYHHKKKGRFKDYYLVYDEVNIYLVNPKNREGETAT